MWGSQWIFGGAKPPRPNLPMIVQLGNKNAPDKLVPAYPFGSGAIYAWVEVADFGAIPMALLAVGCGVTEGVPAAATQVGE